MNGTNYEVPHCGAFSAPHPLPSWAQIFIIIIIISLLKQSVQTKFPTSKMKSPSSHLRRYRKRYSDIKGVQKAINIKKIPILQQLVSNTVNDLYFSRLKSPLP